MTQQGLDPFERLNSGRELDLDTIERANPISEDPILEQESNEIEEEPIISGETELPDSGKVETSADKYDVQIDGNPIYIIASRWKEDGKLPEDFDIKEDITEEEFSKAFYEYKEKLAIDEVEARVYDKLIEEEGLTPEALQTAKLFHFGVNDSDYNRLKVYDALANVQLDPDADNFEDNFKELAVAYYIDKGFTEEQAMRHASRDVSEDEVEPILAEYTEYFANAFNQQQNFIADKIEYKRQEDMRRKQEEIEFINSSLNNRIIAGTEYTKAQMEFVKRAMTEKTELVRDLDGKSRLVTLEQKKILEARNSPEKKLKSRIDFILGIDYKVAADEAAARGKTSLTKDLKSIISVKPKSKPTDSTSTVKHEFEKEL